MLQSIVHRCITHVISSLLVSTESSILTHLDYVSSVWTSCKQLSQLANIKAMYQASSAATLHVVIVPAFVHFFCLPFRRGMSLGVSK